MCSSNPCKNNGLCLFDAVANKIGCKCLNGFDGEFCDDCKDSHSSCGTISNFGVCNFLGLGTMCKKSCNKC